MALFLADENFNNQIVRGVLRQSPDIDIVRVQDVGLSGADDPDILAWAAQERRIVLTHDVATGLSTFN
jgi:predicted nuclease of predicted toxin-antitoxin system